MVQRFHRYAEGAQGFGVLPIGSYFIVGYLVLGGFGIGVSTGGCGLDLGVRAIRAVSAVDLILLRSRHLLPAELDAGGFAAGHSDLRLGTDAGVRNGFAEFAVRFSFRAQRLYLIIIFFAQRAVLKDIGSLFHNRHLLEILFCLGRAVYLIAGCARNRIPAQRRFAGGRVAVNAHLGRRQGRGFFFRCRFCGLFCFRCRRKGFCFCGKYRCGCKAQQQDQRQQA